MSQRRAYPVFHGSKNTLQNALTRIDYFDDVLEEPLCLFVIAFRQGGQLPSFLQVRVLIPSQLVLAHHLRQSVPDELKSGNLEQSLDGGVGNQDAALHVQHQDALVDRVEDG